MQMAAAGQGMAAGPMGGGGGPMMALSGNQIKEFESFYSIFIKVFKTLEVQLQ